MSLLANVNRDGKSTPKAFTSEDFMPQWSGAKKQTWQDMKAMARAINSMYSTDSTKGTDDGEPS